MFTNYGVSGFAILDISQKASEAMREYSVVDISLNLLSNQNPQKISAYILNLSKNLDITIFTTLVGLVQTKVAKAVLDYLEIPYDTKLSMLNIKQIKKILNTLTSWKFEVIKTHGFRYAEVSGGGVDTTQIDEKTMMSKKQKNLYFCGEVLDVVGKRGGYNFAWAWASGFVAAEDITRVIKSR